MKRFMAWFAGLHPLLRALLLWPVLLLAFGVPTALVSIPLIVYKRMTPATPFDYILLVSITGLASFYASYRLRKAAPEKGDDGKALGATVAGFLSFACPICNLLLVSLFGGAFLLTYFEPVRHPLGVAAVLAMVYLVYLERKNCKACEGGS